MSKGRHGGDAYLIGTRITTMDARGDTVTREATTFEKTTKFLFSRFAGDEVVGRRCSDELLAQLAVAMTHHTGAKGRLDEHVPAGYTYLGQFVDHDLTLDESELDLRRQTVAGLESKRSPTLDLDSLYGDGPDQPSSAMFYREDGVRLLTGRPLDVPAQAGPMKQADKEGYDLPRRGEARDGRFGTEREAKIPDVRNDENLAVAQVHAAMIRFHNRVVAQLEGSVAQSRLFERAREEVTLHYQWVLVHDYLPRICDTAVLNDVWANGRRVFEKDSAQALGTMPLEFAGAAFRLGHSMIRESYEWNRNFGSHAGALDSGHIFRLFRFSGTSGTLSPARDNAAPGSPEDLQQLDNPGDNTLPRLPSNWVADWLRLFDFSRFEAQDAAFRPAAFNAASAIDTHLVDPLATLPLGSFGATEAPLIRKRNLAFRNLARGRMLSLPSGQQLAAALNAAGCNIRVLTSDELLNGVPGGIELSKMSPAQKQELLANTPLWFYVLREAELNRNKLGGVGARIVAETMHRALQGSRYNLLQSAFRPRFGPGAEQGRFDMADLLHFAFQGDPARLNPF